MSNRIFIPIGIDCEIADILRQNNLRQFSLPFDWTVTYNGVYEIIKNNFENFLPQTNSLINLLYSIFFIHNIFPDDCEKMNRRVRRFIDLLDSDNELIFLRKSHMNHHHNEIKVNKCTIKNDIDDCNELYNLLINKYPKLRFKIICVLYCNNCFNNKQIDCENIKIYNISNDSNLSFTKIFNRIKDECF